MELSIAAWADWKALCVTTKNLNNQFVEDANGYSIIGPDANGINWIVVVPKQLSDGTTNPDATDFEGTVKASCNFAVGTRPYPFSTPDMQFAGSGFNGTAAKNATTDLWFQLANSFYLSGGEYFTFGAVAGDTLTIDVVDKDGVYAPPGTVLAAPPYMTTWNIPPNDGSLTKFERTYAAKPPPNVYLRFRYVATGTVNDVKFYCNLYLHKPI